MHNLYMYVSALINLKTSELAADSIVYLFMKIIPLNYHYQSCINEIM